MKDSILQIQFHFKYQDKKVYYNLPKLIKLITLIKI